ncbi:MAG: hypothetical protein JNL96_17505 [Planctomycetaceae bacterium]|nr:hypothetical protein [Planctomycetaceae bacterium]
MSAETAEAAVCGVWIEFLDGRGNLLDQHVIDEWHGRPVPQRGDHFHMSDVVGVRRYRGLVIARHFDLQRTADGAPRMWVRLLVRVAQMPKPEAVAEFSRN